MASEVSLQEKNTICKKITKEDLFLANQYSQKKAHNFLARERIFFLANLLGNIVSHKFSVEHTPSLKINLTQFFILCTELISNHGRKVLQSLLNLRHICTVLHS
ncbi:hypothetical protein YC2023_010716 [Brassica napus]